MYVITYVSKNNADNFGCLLQCFTIAVGKEAADQSYNFFPLL